MLVSELIVTQASDEAIQALRLYQRRLEKAVKAEDKDAFFLRVLTKSGDVPVRVFDPGNEHPPTNILYLLVYLHTGVQE